jgi:hypothetical protein
MASKTKKKVKIKISVISIIFLFVISIVFFDFIKGAPDTESLKNLGYSGMEIVNYKVNDLSFSEKTYSFADFNFNSIITKTSTNRYAPELVNQEIYVDNKLDKEIGINISILINIDYDKIRWNGTEYNLKDYTIDKPLKLDSWIDSKTGNLLAPSIFFDEIYNKRINYKDVAEQGGYALVYQDKEMNYIELVIKDKKINAFESSKIDPTYSNATDGFFTTTFGSDAPYGMTTNVSLVGGSPTDFWIVDYSDGFVYRVSGTGVNKTGGFKISTFGAANPFGITTNNSDFWITDYWDYFVYHTDRTGANIADGFSTSAIGSSNPRGITTNGTDNTPTDFWIVDNNDYFMYHTNRTGTNKTDGFSLLAIGSTNPTDVTTNGSDFWVVDNDDDFIYHTNKAGTNMTDGFKTTSFGSDYPQGITTNGSDFWVSDFNDKFVYHYYPNTCSYSSGNWDINCVDNCVLSIGYNGTDRIKYNFTMSGTGQVTLNTNISNFSYYRIKNGCNVTCGAGCFRI